MLTALLRLKKDPCKHLFYSVLVESVPEVITDGGKMRNRFIEQIAKKPPVCDIHADLFHGTPQGWDPIQVLDEHHLKQTAAAGKEGNGRSRYQQLIRRAACSGKGIINIVLRMRPIQSVTGITLYWTR